MPCVSVRCLGVKRRRPSVHAIQLGTRDNPAMHALGCRVSSVASSADTAHGLFPEHLRDEEQLIILK